MSVCELLKDGKCGRFVSLSVRVFDEEPCVHLEYFIFPAVSMQADKWRCKPSHFLFLTGSCVCVSVNERLYECLVCFSYCLYTGCVSTRESL